MGGSPSGHDRDRSTIDCSASGDEDRHESNHVFMLRRPIERILYQEINSSVEKQVGNLAQTDLSVVREPFDDHNLLHPIP